ncbi:MAG TPA: hypothetical protein VN457_08445, partial [Chlamydiales bacterium]|nr:hypothetical protein [Chlamydiales bacterium]
SHVNKEMHNVVASTAFSEAVSLVKQMPISRTTPRTSVKKCSKDEGAEVHFDYECYPNVPNIDLASLEAKPATARVIPESDVDAEIYKQRLSRADYQDIDDPEHLVQEGDYIEIDLDVIENPAHNVFTSRLFPVKKEHMPAWAFDAVLGMKKGESKEVEALHEVEEGHVHTAECKHDTEPKKCRIHLDAIKRGNLPELNDAFAALLGCKSVQELRQKIRASHEAHAADIAKETTRSMLLQELLQKYPFDLPHSFFDSEVRLRFQNVKKIREQRQGALPKDKAAEADALLLQEVNSISYGYLSCVFLMNTIASQLKIQYHPSYDELMEELMREQLGPEEQRVIFQGMPPEEVRTRLETRLFMRKVLDQVAAQLQH